MRWEKTGREMKWNLACVGVKGTFQVVLVVKNPPANAGDIKRLRVDPWARKIPWRRTWQPIPVFLPGESPGQRSLVGYSPWGCKGLDQLQGPSTHGSYGAQKVWKYSSGIDVGVLPHPGLTACSGLNFFLLCPSESLHFLICKCVIALQWELGFPVVCILHLSII